MLETVDASALPENILRIDISPYRAWNGIRLDVAEFQCSGPAVHQLRHESQSRLSVVLDEVGGQCEPRVRKDQPCPVPHMPRHMHFAPADMEMWGYSANIRFVRDASLIFDLESLRERTEIKFSTDASTTPRLRFADDRIWPLVRLLADAVNDTDPSTQLYGDGLTAAITARLFGTPQTSAADAKGLAASQLARVIDYLDARLPERVELSDLAMLAGVSQSQFSRAFKISTGLAPYRWQLDARIRRAQVMLLDTRASLEHIADATGFADAVHFGKTFRKLVGATPAAWRHDRMR